MNCDCTNCTYLEEFCEGQKYTKLHRLIVCSKATPSSIRKALIKEDPNARDIFGNTPLHFAAVHGGDVENIRKVICAGAEVHILNNEGTTPLHWAVSLGHRRVVEILIECGASVNFPDRKGQIALHCAFDLQHSNSPDIWVVKKLIDAGSKINVKSDAAETPLIQAVRVGDSDVVRELLIHGANANICNNEAFPLHVAVDKNEPNEELITELIKHGACIRSRNKKNLTPLELAVAARCSYRGYKLKTAKILIKVTTLVNPDKLVNFAGLPRTRVIFKLHQYETRCSSAVARMKSFQVTDNISLHDFALRGINCSVFSHSNLIHHLYMSVLNYFLSGRDCSVYNDMAREHFPELFLRKILMNVKIYAMSRNGLKKVTLVSDVIFTITGYLNRRDMIQLLAAFTTMEGINIFDV